MKTERDRIADEVVRKTERWPEDNVVPDDMESQDLIYHSAPEQELSLKYFTRKDTDAARPAIVFIHGGSWRGGDNLQFCRQGMYLAQKYNIFSVCINYRFGQVAKFPAALQDCKAAVRWVRSVADKFNIDTQRIGVVGGSAGAHLASLTALTGNVEKYEGAGPYQEFDSDVHMAVLFNGHFDMADQLRDHVQDAAMHNFFGAHPWELPGVYGEASPFLWVNEKSPPMLFLHGDQDHYPHRQSIAMHERLQHYGVYSELEIYEGIGHAWFNKQPACENTTLRMAQFIEHIFNLKTE
ncbi:MAG TPA: alpha/beta hydrolase [Phycisphaerae bacterium]|nr:alpha/beta hydrolase [Phycisphaerae bacterium]